MKMHRIWYAAIFVVVFFGKATIATPTVKLVNATLDMFIVLHRGAQGDSEVRQYLQKDLLRALRENYEFGESKTRLAILGNVAWNDTNDGWHVFMDLTGEPDEQIIEQIGGASKDFDLSKPLKMIREDTEKIPKKATAVVVISSPISKGIDVAESSFCAIGKTNNKDPMLKEEIRNAVLQELKILKGTNAGVYAISRCADDDEEDGFKKVMEQGEFATLIRPQGGLFNDSSSLIHRLKLKTDKQLCVSSRVCAFDEQGNCSSLWFTPNVPIESGDCGHIEPPPSDVPFSCEPVNCDATCDEFWPLESARPNCNETCGNFSLRRRGELKWMELQYCPVDLQCDPCAATLSPAKTSEPRSGSVEPPESPTSRLTSNSATSQRFSDVDANSLGTQDPNFQQSATSLNAGNPKMEFKPWVIAIVVIVAVAAICAVVGAVVITRSRKRRRGRVNMYVQKMADPELDETSTAISVSKRSEPASLSESVLQKVAAMNGTPSHSDTMVSLRSAVCEKSPHHYSTITPPRSDRESTPSAKEKSPAKGKAKPSRIFVESK